MTDLRFTKGQAVEYRTRADRDDWQPGTFVAWDGEDPELALVLHGKLESVLTSVENLRLPQAPAAEVPLEEFGDRLWPEAKDRSFAASLGISWATFCAVRDRFLGRGDRRPLHRHPVAEIAVLHADSRALADHLRAAHQADAGDTLAARTAFHEEAHGG
jgi:hypothetical protein